MSLHGLRTGMENWLCPRAVHIGVKTPFEHIQPHRYNNQIRMATHRNPRPDSPGKWKRNGWKQNTIHMSIVDCFMSFDCRCHCAHWKHHTRTPTARTMCPVQFVRLPEARTSHWQSFAQRSTPSIRSPLSTYVWKSRRRICMLPAPASQSICDCVFHINHMGTIYLSKVSNIIKIKSKILNELGKVHPCKETMFNGTVMDVSENSIQS